MVRNPIDKHGLYFEGILQLRDVEQDVVDFVEDELLRGGIKVAKVMEVKGGLDFYLSDNNYTKGLGKKLQEKFGGEIKSSAKLHTMRGDKELYRVTILFRPTTYNKGDKVMYKGEVYIVNGLYKTIWLQHEKTGQKIQLKYKEMESIRRIDTA
ncbi:hypothetical protein HYV86_00630 [Candidatus Woesearchaeota archaeon]|nr:hypothetical protein [Candidatus Woesearchaeota archaeon]